MADGKTRQQQHRDALKAAAIKAGFATIGELARAINAGAVIVVEVKNVEMVVEGERRS